MKEVKLPREGNLLSPAGDGGGAGDDGGGGVGGDGGAVGRG